MPGIVTNPTAGDVHVNTPLTNFGQKYMQDQNMFVGLNAMPNLPVAKQSDLYYEFSRADFFRDTAEERADGTESAGGGFRLATFPYFARVYAFHKDVTDRQRANADPQVALERSATQFVMMKLMIRRERLFQSTFFNTSIWGTDVSGIAASPVEGTSFLFWDRPDSDPIVDVRTAIRTVHQNTGMRPNKMLIGRAGWDTLLDNDAILARIEGGATRDMPAMVMRQLVASLFELDAVFVMDSVVNTGAEGNPAHPITSRTDLNANESNSFIGADNALVYYAPDTVGLEEPTAGMQFSWTGLMGNTDAGMRIKRFRMEQTESDRIEGQMTFDYRVVAPELGYFFSNVRT